MALPASFLEELRARTPMAALVGRKVKLARSGRQQKGCCPFHAEKTPSFYVYDDGFHCFGCGAHGDAISFVMQSEGVPFLDAVTRLAGEAGLEVPAPTPQAAEQEQRRLDVHAVLEQAEILFRRLLFTSEGAAGLAYLRGRDITDDTIGRHGLGWAPAGRGALLAALSEHGIEAAQAVEAGLAQENDAGSSSGAFRALFFDRIIFPIRDARGRLVSFGGRTLGDAQPKYLNGPETAVYSKRRTLYGLDRAVAATRTGATVLVVEGYMDVLRLHQSGFPAAVAPLGTALTSDQLALLWRLSPTPILCFDGDAAGGRAAGRTLELALPLVQPDRTLQIASLPAGEDPDSLVRTRGPAALQGLLDSANATAFADTLYNHIRDQVPGAGPEEQARLHRRLTESAAQIQDSVLAREMRGALLGRFFADKRKRWDARAPVRRSFVPNRVKIVPALERVRILTAILLNHPDLLHDLEEAYALVDLPQQLERLRDEIRTFASQQPEPLDSASLLTHLTASGRAADAAQALADMPLPASAASGAMPAEAEAQWWHFFGLLDLGGLNAQVERAIRDFADDPTEHTERRLVALCNARERLRSGELAEPDA